MLATLVVTVVNSINNDQIGSIIKFAIANIDKINAVSFQPVSFTGRDEHIDDETHCCTPGEPRKTSLKPRHPVMT